MQMTVKLRSESESQETGSSTSVEIKIIVNNRISGGGGQMHLFCKIENMQIPAFLLLLVSSYWNSFKVAARDWEEYVGTVIDEHL